jgi:MFS family permease
MADVIGRKKIFVTTAVLISIGSFGSALCGNSAAFTVYSQLACWRCVPTAC